MKRSTVGALLVFAPPIMLIGTLAGYAIASFVLSTTIASGGGDEASMLAVGMVINVVLGFIGIASIAGLIIGVPVGIYLMATADEKSQAKSMQK